MWNIGFLGFQFAAKGKSGITANAVNRQSVASAVKPLMEAQETK
jgi:hypothetical protein